MNKLEHIIKAKHSMEFCVSDLQGALSSSTELESIIIFDLLEKAAKLKNDLAHLERAMSDESAAAI